MLLQTNSHMSKLIKKMKIIETNTDFQKCAKYCKGHLLLQGKSIKKSIKPEKDQTINFVNQKTKLTITHCL